MRLKACLVFGLTLLASLLLPMITYAQSIGDLGSWQTASSTLAPGQTKPGMNSFATVRYNGYVYALGGFDSSTYLNKVNYAKLNADGSVGTWQSTTSLPVGIAYHSAVQYNGYIYVIGGVSNATYLDTTYYAHINNDGTVGAWQSTSSLPVTGGAAGAVTYNGYIYRVGGSNGGGVLTSPYYAKINADGSLGAWQTSSSTLPHGLYQTSTIVNNGYVYILGGFGRSDVYYAKLNADGSVDAWQTGTSLSQITGNGTSVVINGYVYVIGGSDVQLFDTFEYAKLNADGSVGTWQTSSNTLPRKLAAGSAVMYNGFVYYIDGSFDSGGGSTDLSTNVYYAQANFPSASTAISNSITAASVVVTSPFGTVETCANSVSEASLGKQDSYEYPLGLVNVCYQTANPTNQITMTFVTNLSPSQVVARDYNPATQNYVTVPGAVIISTTYNGHPALQLTYTIADNGPLDTDSAEGIVNDPVGLALIPAGAPNTGYGEPAHPFNATRALVIIASVVSLVFGARLLSQQKRTNQRWDA